MVVRTYNPSARGLGGYLLSSSLMRDSVSKIRWIGPGEWMSEVILWSPYAYIHIYMHTHAPTHEPHKPFQGLRYLYTGVPFFY